jgi:uncharacterized protein
MRKKELEIRDQKQIEEVLKTTLVGYLAFNGPDGWPRITPLNFVFDGRILWHGATAGERFEVLKVDSRATFAAQSLETYIPSYFTSEENACAATYAFKSVMIFGRCNSIQDPQEKCAILNQLMNKYQPEGKYRKISPQDPLYEKLLSATGIYALTVEEMVGKFKLLQNRSEMDRKKIASRLIERGSPEDLIISQEILKTL